MFCAESVFGAEMCGKLEGVYFGIGEVYIELGLLDWIIGPEIEPGFYGEV